MSTKNDQAEFLLEKIRELSSKSLTQREIAAVMKVSPTTVNKYIQILRQRSKANISKYVDETLVHEFDKINTGLEQIVKNSWQRYEAVSTDKEKYMYLSLAKETYQIKAALLDSSTIIDKAIKFVQSHNRDRGLTTQNDKVTIDHTEEQAQPEQTDRTDRTHNDELTES